MFLLFCANPGCVSYSRNVNEGCIPPVEEGAIEDLQNEREVLQREDRDGGTQREQQALQGGQEQGQGGGAQIRLLLSFSYMKENGQERLRKVALLHTGKHIQY